MIFFVILCKNWPAAPVSEGETNLPMLMMTSAEQQFRVLMEADPIVRRELIRECKSIHPEVGMQIEVMLDRFEGVSGRIDLRPRGEGEYPVKASNA